MTPARLSGGCLCGGVRFEVEPPFRRANYCHCSRCRKHAGSNALAQGRVAMITQAMASRGMDQQTAHAAAMRVIDGQITLQANVLAFEKIYLLSGVLLLVALPLMVFMRYGKPMQAGGGRAVAAHAE